MHILSCKYTKYILRTSSAIKRVFRDVPYYFLHTPFLSAACACVVFLNLDLLRFE